jgi:Cu/Zn superoxide dismutase
MVRLISVLVCLSLALPVVRAQNYAVAEILGSAANSPIKGKVTFEQDASAPLGDMTVTYSITGLPPSPPKGFGFHVHQFGDTRITDTLETMAAHFVPFMMCDNPTDDACKAMIENDSVHGMPGMAPLQRRQPGDMGNIPCDPNIFAECTDTSAGGVVSGTLVIGQGKMSLTDPMRSIVGRVIVIHSKTDLGGTGAQCKEVLAGEASVLSDCCCTADALAANPPTCDPQDASGADATYESCDLDLTYGAAGLPLAYGVIGLGNPTKAGRTVNAAQAPTTPKVDKIACTFEPPGVSGVALLSLQEPCDKSKGCTARMQAKLQGMAAGKSHSFHFHEWGDMTVDITKAGELGEIYYSKGITVDEITVTSSGEAQYDVNFDLGKDVDNLLEHVGRSLTVHEGPDKSTPTIAAAACGLANPLSKLENMQPVSQPSKQAMSDGVIALVVVVAIVFPIVLVIVVLYVLKKPIPLCGKCIYGKDGFKEVSVPPPAGMVRKPSVGPPAPLEEWSRPPPGPPPGSGKV